MGYEACIDSPSWKNKIKKISKFNLNHSNQNLFLMYYPHLTSNFGLFTQFVFSTPTLEDCRYQVDVIYTDLSNAFNVYMDPCRLL